MWFGRGTADNKGQHSINIGALRAVLETRGRLRFNAKYLIEMGEEKVSPGLRELAESQKELFHSDVLIAFDDPRLSAERRTVFLGSGLSPSLISGAEPPCSRLCPSPRDRGKFGESEGHSSIHSMGLIDSTVDSAMVERERSTRSRA